MIVSIDADALRQEISRIDTTSTPKLAIVRIGGMAEQRDEATHHLSTFCPITIRPLSAEGYGAKGDTESSEPVGWTLNAADPREAAILAQCGEIAVLPAGPPSSRH